MTTDFTRLCEDWRYCDDPPGFDWDERIVLGSGAFEYVPRTGEARSPRILLIGHSRDPDLAAVAAQLGSAGATLEVLLVDRIGHRDGVVVPAVVEPRRYDVGYCREYRSNQVVHYHFDRSLRRSRDWRAVRPESMDHASAQSDVVLWGWLASVSVARWVNSPWRLRDSENKVTQLVMATRAGLRVPQTLVTTDAVQSQRFAGKFPAGVVSKSLSSPVVSRRDGTGHFLYTSAVAPEEIRSLAYPCLFQERLVPETEHRVTIVGKRTFSVAIRRNSAHQTDWRREPEDHRRFEHHRLPPNLVGAIQQLMDELGIQVGAVDLIETSEDTYFLEINPSAALLWLERALGMQLCRSVTNLILCAAQSSALSRSGS